MGSQPEGLTGAEASQCPEVGLCIWSGTASAQMGSFSKRFLCSQDKGDFIQVLTPSLGHDSKTQPFLGVGRAPRGES